MAMAKYNAHEYTTSIGTYVSVYKAKGHCSNVNCELPVAKFQLRGLLYIYIFQPLTLIAAMLQAPMAKAVVNNYIPSCVTASCDKYNVHAWTTINEFAASLLRQKLSTMQSKIDLYFVM